MSIFDDKDFMQEAMKGLQSELFSYVAEDMYNKENGITVQPDTIGVDFFFLYGFFTYEMLCDFHIIEQDFMENCHGKIKQFNELAYYTEAYIGSTKPVDASYGYVLRLIYNGAKLGDEYCVELIKKLYKTYYKKEYNQLKRFSSIGMDDVLEIAGNEDSFTEDLGTARLLAIAPFFNIKIEEKAAIMYKLCERKREAYLHLVEDATAGLELSQDVVDEATDQVDEWIEKSNKDSSLAETYKDVGKFIEEAFRYEGFLGSYDKMCMNNFRGGREHLVMTLALLKTINPKREYTFDEVQIYTNIRDLVIALTDTANNFDDQVAFLLGEEVDEDSIKESSFKPNSIAASKDKKENKIEKTVTTAPVEIKNATTEDYIKEIDELRAKANRLEQQNKNLREDLKSYKEKSKSSDYMISKYESERDELIALRNFAYKSTKQEDLPDETGIDQMQRAISEKKIAIIGGHPNWINKLKKKFPNWSYIQINESSRYIFGDFGGYDMVYFFTGFISHKDYYRYVAAIRKADVSFGYMDGEVNIEKNIVQIYNDFFED
ncbi:MAG: hypothetical protein IJ683_01930 [Butyrivibrio sp.]|nr:hypothetical protein [Butyrivibrio sp.]MBR1641064.1 hypothetical protein [Butyrivibrio sp.]